MRCAILTIGEELLNGVQLDSNSAELSTALTAAGWEVMQIVTVGDTLEEIVAALEFLKAKGELVVVCGGLGPTSDDRTRYAAAQFFQQPLELDPEELKRIALLLQKRSRPWAESNSVQALKPRTARWLSKSLGTAAGFVLERGVQQWYFLPGVPSEMRHLLKEEILPALPPVDFRWLRRELRFWNYGESQLSQRLAGWDWGGEWRFSSLPSTEGVALKVERKMALPASDDHRRTIEKELDDKVLALRHQLDAEQLLYSDRGRSIEEEVAEQLSALNLRVAVAESCTGGGIGRRLTRLPGISAQLAGGVIAYSNELKQSILGVKNETIEQEGAVSKAVVEEMARGVAALCGVECAVAVSGIAGPSGGTDDKPVGTVWVAAYCLGEMAAECYHLFTLGGRQEVQKRSEVAALFALFELLQKKRR